MEPARTPWECALSMAMAVFILLVLTALATPARADTVIDWSQEKDGTHKNYSVDGLSLTITAAKNSDGESPRLEVTSRGGATTTVYGAERSFDTPVKMRIAKLDPLHGDIDVMFGTFTGGAHRCIAIKVLSLIDGAWKVANLGNWDGDGMPEPLDIKPDGPLALVFGDDAFLYAFTFYAGSATPLKILRMQNGEVVDVSTDPAFKYQHRQNMIESQKSCARHGNGGCAAYVASAARIGLFPEAWNFMLRNYDRRSDWKLEFCDIPGKEKCIKTVAFDSFPRALDWFLRKQGYLQPVQATQPSISGMTTTAVLCGGSVEYRIDQAGVQSPVLGVWVGNWGNPGRLCAGLIVGRIGADGVAEVIYVYGPSGPSSRIPWRQQTPTALVSLNGNITFQDDQGSTFVFNLESTGVLSGRFIGRSGNLTGLFARSQP